jgi:site-specific recombinase XerD
MIAIRSFLKYLSKIDIESLAPEKIELADTPERSIDFLEPDELERIRNSYTDKNRLELRNRAILEVLFSTGVRVSELTGLNRNQINLDHEEFSVDGKGGKLRVVFLSGEAKEWVSKYLESRHDKDSALFIKEPKADEVDLTAKEMKDSGGRLTTRQIERIVQEAAKRAGIVKKVTPHVLRHSFATDILRAGADLRSVQSLLGHSSITTTQVYTHITDKHLHEIHKKFHNKTANDKAESQNDK